MADTFLLEITTPEKLIIREPVSEAQIPAENGYLGILPGHAPLLAILGIGELSYTSAGRRRVLAVSGGFVEVTEGHVRVLADVAEKADQIDVARAQMALKRASDRLSHPEDSLDVARALNAAKRAQVRIDCAKHR